jgi:hypothetical protein
MQTLAHYVQLFKMNISHMLSHLMGWHENLISRKPFVTIFDLGLKTPS